MATYGIRELPQTEQPRQDNALPSEDYVVKTMPPIAGSLDLTATFVLIIFFITNVATAIQGGAGTFTYWIVGAITFFIPCVIATAQLGVLFPHEGSLYNWTHRAFGGYWSFFVAFCAWFPGVLLMIVSADVIVGYLQGLNANWLPEPWQQGLVLIFILALSGFIAVQRFRTVLNLAKVVLAVAFIAVLLVGAAGVVWLLRGNAPATSFKTLADWGFTSNPQAYGYSALALFAFITQAYLGIEAPLNMGGEIKGRKVITRHLLWGTLLVLAGYFIVSFAVLVVTGTSLSGNGYALVMTVTPVFGQLAGDITAGLVMLNFVITPVIYNYAYARLLLVGGIDQRLPVNIGRLNKNRVPANAIIFQTVIAVFFAGIVFLVVPYVTHIDSAQARANLNSEVYNVIISASTLVWALSTAFLFVNLVRFYFTHRNDFLKQLIVPMPILWLCIIVGTAACGVSIAGALLFSAIPSLIGNQQWFFLVGGITMVCLIIAGIGAMLASSEADWQRLNK